jgi:hypothetical protein
MRSTEIMLRCFGRKVKYSSESRFSDQTFRRLEAKEDL